MNVGKALTVYYTPGWGMFELHLTIGTAFDPWTNTPRTANNCRMNISEHVWSGKDVKIGKNVRIGRANIIGWGSIVTKSFEDSNLLMAGTPAKIIKTDVQWDGRTINESMKMETNE